MIFRNLYKLNANLEKGRQPMNHLSSENDFSAFCGQKGVGNMGSKLEYRDGKWFAKHMISEFGVEIPQDMLINYTCATCLSHAYELIKKEYQSK